MLMRKDPIFIRKAKFSTSSFLQADKARNPMNIFKELQELRDEKDVLKKDLDLIGDAVRAASKYEVNETPLIHEASKIQELMDSYPAFFESDSDSDNDNNEKEFSSSLPNKVMGIKSYLRSELRSNEEVTKRVMLGNSRSFLAQKASKGKKRAIDQFEEDPKGKRRAIDQLEEDPKGKGKERAIDQPEDNFKGKQKTIIETGESSSRNETQSQSNKNIDSYSDWIDSMYNPFDDMGTD